MARYDPETQWRIADPKVIAGFLRAVDELHPPERLILALFEAGIVESNLQTNLKRNDLDSLGPLQQRKGWGTKAARLDPYRAALAFLRDGVLTNRAPLRNAKTAGQLAQAVQRSAYPDRYDEAEDAARYIIERAVLDREAKGAPVDMGLRALFSRKTLAWHLAPSLAELRDEINAQWPKRKKTSDGTLGDASHAARPSEHNPDRDADSMPTGAVSAMDITKDSAAQMETIRKALIADDRVWYVIHAGYIYSRTHGFAKRKYTGSNPHTKHLHVSLMQTKKAHDDISPWGIYKSQVPKPPVTPPKPSAGRKLGSRTLKRGNTGADIKVLQRFLGIEDDGVYGPITEARVKWYQGERHMKKTGIADKATVGPIVKIVYGK
jgi:hypothetical protein